MNDYAEQASQLWNNQEALKALWWDALYLVLILFALALLKNVLQQVIDGIFWRKGTELKAHDIILFDGEHGRIVKLGWIKTEFYFYKKWTKDKDGRLVPRVATTETFLNARLSDHRIERYIELVNLTSEGIDIKDGK